MAAGTHNFTIEQGTTLEKKIVWKDNSATPQPINLTGYSARMMVRSAISDVSPLITLTTENGGITLGGVTGEITLNQTDVQTAAYNWVTGVYDLELISGTGKVTRLLKGVITVDPEVTRT